MEKSAIEFLKNIKKDVFILDIPESRPIKIQQIIRENKNIIKLFIKKEKYIERQQSVDIMKRLNPPINNYKKIFDDIIFEIEQELEKYKIMGFHCSKLTNFEINNIKNNGLYPTNKKLTESKLMILKENNIISNMEYELLLKNNLSEDNNREGKIYFFHFLLQLKDKGGLQRLLGERGGECIYREQKDEKIKNKLKEIGIPSIVVVEIEYKDLKQHQIGKRLAYTINNPRKRYLEAFDSYITEKITVYKIITAEDRLFEKLTNYKKR